jgi:hypothetical protein
MKLFYIFRTQHLYQQRISLYYKALSKSHANKKNSVKRMFPPLFAAQKMNICSILEYVADSFFYIISNKSYQLKFAIALSPYF